MAEELTVSRDADVPVLFRIGLMRAWPYLLARFQQVETHAREIDRKQAQRVLSYAIKLDEAWPQVCDLLIAMAPKMEQAGHRDDWIVYLESGIEKSQKLEDLEAEGELRFYIGILSEQLAKYDEARGQFETSAAYFEQLGNPHHQARALNRLAYVARRQRRFEQAKRLAEYSLELSEGIKTEQAYSYFVLGAIAYDHQAWQDAYEFFSKSLVLREEIEDKRMIAWSLTNLGAALEGDQKYKDAIFYYKRAINLFDTVQDPVHEAVTKMNLGNIYLVTKRFEQALDLYLETESTFHKTKAWFRLAAINNNKALVYQQLQQWDKAKEAYELSIKQWQQIGNMNQVVNAMDNLGLVYLEQNLCDDAIAIFQDALNQLAQIENDPTYDYLFEMVSRHLQDVRERCTC